MFVFATVVCLFFVVVVVVVVWVYIVDICC